MQNEVAKLKKQINRSENEAQELILAKYIQNYELYEKVYSFYWNTICGKKVNYPMSSFISTLRNQAIRFDYQTGF